MNDKHAAPILVLLLGAILLAACGGSTATSGGARGIARPTLGSGTAFAPQKSVTGVPAPGTTDVVQPLPAPVPPVGEGPRVIRNARVAVEVRNGAFDSTLNQIFQLSTDLGGYISGSDASADSGALRTGTITFLVPVDRFTDAVARVRALGTVQNLVISGQDVSAQYVDLEARLKNAEAQRDAMLALLAQAKSVPDIIAVQTQLGNITAQIEQLKGQIGYYDHATTYSTVSVSVHEAALAAKPATDSWGFVSALSQGLHGFAATLDYILLGVGYAGPVLILLLLGFGAWRLRRRFAL